MRLPLVRGADRRSRGSRRRRAGDRECLKIGRAGSSVPCPSPWCRRQIGWPAIRAVAAHPGSARRARPRARHPRAASQARKGRGERLWPWSRMTGWRAIHPCRHSKPPGSDGRHASPKGLRHASATRCRVRRHLVHLVHKWLGHAQLATTAADSDDGGQAFRSKPSSDSDPRRPGIPTIPARVVIGVVNGVRSPAQRQA
jgi:hypothetical protein